MAEQFERLEHEHVQFIGRQQLFFVGTAGTEGRVNISPKGMDSFRVVAPDRVAWLNLTGSGNETAAHVLENGRMTILFCSFERQPLIMRLYGVARASHPRDQRWRELEQLFPDYPGGRQVFEMDLDLVQTSCGYAVPHYQYQGERDTLVKWSEKRGQSGIETYWRERNGVSLDGKDTGIG
ncbi:MAG: pyridoxamine 5'-phosphate oxidase family protein [Haliea sp.]|nr:pyridoxamine 5'-phosphate oxidase family protein [Haliea sp.]